MRFRGGLDAFYKLRMRGGGPEKRMAGVGHPANPVELEAARARRSRAAG